MIPTLQQFRRWNYPSKFAFVSFFIAIGVSVAFWLFPDGGKQLMTYLLGEENIEAVRIPGRNIIERQINLAKMQGAARSDPSTEFAIAVPFARPSMSRSTPAKEWHAAGLIALSNASPLRSSNQDVVFAPGRCRFLGVVQWQDRAKLMGEANISLMSCVLENGDSYQFGVADGPPIGFVVLLETPMNRSLPLIEEDRSVTLPLSKQYVVRLLAPLSSVPLKGKSSAVW